MKKIIKLSAIIGDNYTNCVNVYILTRNIVYFKAFQGGKTSKTEVFFITGESIIVKESPEEIKKLLS